MSALYRTIVADPPWHYPDFVSYPGTRVDRNKEGLKGGQRRVTKPLPYESMTVEGQPSMGRLPSSVIACPGNSGGSPKHSRKPEIFLDLIESASPSPRLELFARRNRFGWDTWGNEALNHVNVGESA